MKQLDVLHGWARVEDDGSESAGALQEFIVDQAREEINLMLAGLHAQFLARNHADSFLQPDPDE